ncbi:MAG TPA: hypothetical protein VFG90_11500, partial [Nitrososphaeraceae archaeon]|nr:hypothetical protein [Nitrososphaeraceae archaeon]
LYRCSLRFPILRENEIQTIKILIITILSRFSDIESRESLIRNQIISSKENKISMLLNYFHEYMRVWLLQKGMVN